MSRAGLAWLGGGIGMIVVGAVIAFVGDFDIGFGVAVIGAFAAGVGVSMVIEEWPGHASGGEIAPPRIEHGRWWIEDEAQWSPACPKHGTTVCYVRTKWCPAVRRRVA